MGRDHVLFLISYFYSDSSRMCPVALVVWRGAAAHLARDGGDMPTHDRARASSAKTRGFHTQLDEGPETP